MSKSAGGTLTACLLLKAWLSYYSVKRVMTTYCQGINHLLETYITDSLIAETDSKNAGNVQLSDRWPLQFVNELSLKPLECPQVYDESVLK